MKVLPMLNDHSNVVAMLPSAHMYGMMFEVLFELTVGTHVHFLTRVPSPKIIMQALAEIRPDVVIAVPLIIEKVYKSKLKPLLEKEGIRFAMRLPVISQIIQKKIREEQLKRIKDIETKELERRKEIERRRQEAAEQERAFQKKRQEVEKLQRERCEQIEAERAKQKVPHRKLG